VPIDGIEAYYPAHSDEQIDMFLAYAAEHNLLVSAGSDSHGPDRLPIKYPAAKCRALLERLGVTVL
jgi:3',5'-nucleoside bisphosphate phosphatase